MNKKLKSFDLFIQLLIVAIILKTGSLPYVLLFLYLLFVWQILSALVYYFTEKHGRRDTWLPWGISSFGLCLILPFQAPFIAIIISLWYLGISIHDLAILYTRNDLDREPPRE
jgi:hypothetical protein